MDRIQNAGKPVGECFKSLIQGAVGSHDSPLSKPAHSQPKNQAKHPEMLEVWQR